MNLDRTEQKKLIHIVRTTTTNQIRRFYQIQGLILKVYDRSLEKFRDDMVLRTQWCVCREGQRPHTRNVHKLTVSEGKLTGEIRFNHTITKVYWDTTSRVWKPQQ